MAKRQASDVNTMAKDVHIIAGAYTKMLEGTGQHMAIGGMIGGPGGVDNVPI